MNKEAELWYQPPPDDTHARRWPFAKQRYDFESTKSWWQTVENIWTICPCHADFMLISPKVVLHIEHRSLINILRIARPTVTRLRAAKSMDRRPTNVNTIVGPTKIVLTQSKFYWRRVNKISMKFLGHPKLYWRNPNYIDANQILLTVRQ